MSFQIDFQKKQSYESLTTGITINAVLRYGNREQLCPGSGDRTRGGAHIPARAAVSRSVVERSRTAIRSH